MAEIKISPQSTKFPDPQSNFYFQGIATHLITFSSGAKPGVYKTTFGLAEGQMSSMLIHEDGHCVVNHPKIGPLLKVGYDQDLHMPWYQIDEQMFHLLSSPGALHNFVASGEIVSWLRSLEYVGEDGYSDDAKPEPAVTWHPTPPYTIGGAGGYIADPSLQPLVRRLTDDLDNTYNTIKKTDDLLRNLKFGPTLDLSSYENGHVGIIKGGE